MSVVCMLASRVVVVFTRFFTFILLLMLVNKHLGTATEKASGCYSGCHRVLARSVIGDVRSVLHPLTSFFDTVLVFGFEFYPGVLADTGRPPIGSPVSENII